MLSGRAGTASAIPSGSGGDDAWGLFGANDAAAAPKPDAPQNAPPPRASSHPFFASARFAWSSDAPFDRDAMTRELLDRSKTWREDASGEDTWSGCAMRFASAGHRTGARRR